MDLDEALRWTAIRRHVVLITLRRDGRAQSSDVICTTRDGRIDVSLTADRAKTANMRRDPRVVVHVTDPATYSYISIDATAELSAVAAAPGDPVVDNLVDLYRAITGEEHDDWDDYRSAMVAEKRLVAQLTPHRAVGHMNG